MFFFQTQTDLPSAWIWICHPFGHGGPRSLLPLTFWLWLQQRMWTLIPRAVMSTHTNTRLQLNLMYHVLPTEARGAEKQTWFLSWAISLLLGALFFRWSSMIWASASKAFVRFRSFLRRFSVSTSLWLTWKHQSWFIFSLNVIHTESLGMTIFGWV